jgi:hypothetical protein
MQLEELVLRIRRGDKEAVKELVSVYGSAVYHRAFERTHDKELAREAARQTFGQFVAIVQQQPDDDGWSLWFGDLIERNITTYAQISTDMRTIESELDQEIDTPPPPAPPAHARPDPIDEPEDEIWRPTNASQKAEKKPGKTKTGKQKKAKNEIFDGPYKNQPKAGKKHSLSILLLILLSMLLLWMVAGVAMAMRMIPAYDMGYTWFNQHVFKLF